MNNCVVVGGAGFIGSHLCEKLLNLGNNVLCIDNLITGNVSNIENIYNLKSFNFIRDNAVNKTIEKTLKKELGYINEIYYLASIASPSQYINKPFQTISANINGLHNFLDIALTFNAKLFYSSTSEVYGEIKEIPVSETYLGNVNTTGNRAVYDESKRMGETLVCTYYREYGLNIRIARIFNTFGPKMQKNDGRVIPNFICNALQDKPLIIYKPGFQNRSFCYIDDMIEGIVALMKCDYKLPVNIGNPYNKANFNIKRLAEEIIAITGSCSKIETVENPFDNDPKIRIPNIELMRNKTGWSPKVNFNTGIVKTIEFFKGDS